MIIIPEYLIDADYPIYFKVIITPVGGSPIDVSDDIMMDGENVFSDSAGSSAFPIGCVLTKCVTFTIDNSLGQYDDYDFYGAQIQFSFVIEGNFASSYLLTETEDKLLTEDGTYLIYDRDTGSVVVDRGIYYVTLPVSISDNIEITALDKSYRLDTPYQINVALPAKRSTVLADICLQANIQADVTFHNLTQLGNDERLVTNIPENSTCRDILGQLAATEGANARIDNAGVLKFIKWDFTRTDYTLTNFMESPEVSSSDLSITGVKVVSGEETSGGLYGTEEYKLTLNIPIISGASVAEESDPSDTPIEQLVAVYVGNMLIDKPFRIMRGTYIPNVMIEFGDMACSMDKNDKVYVTPITDFSFTLFGSTSVETKSETPIQSASKFTSASQSVLQQQINTKKRVFVTQPTPPYAVGDLWVNGDEFYYCISPKVVGQTFDMDDWDFATSYTHEQEVQEAINHATALITGATGGNIIIHTYPTDPENPTPLDGKPYEILITDNADESLARNVWRWNLNGLAHSSNGVNGPYDDAAILADGSINAKYITTGELSGSVIKAGTLSANTIMGGTLTLGGANNGNGQIDILNKNGSPIGGINKDGLLLSTPNGGTLTINPTEGLVVKDSNNNPIYWVREDEFRMRKGVAEQELSVGLMVRMIAITIEESGTIINKGLAFVGYTET